jgi:hypothetical protein
VTMCEEPSWLNVRTELPICESNEDRSQYQVSVDNLSNSLSIQSDPQGESPGHTFWLDDLTYLFDLTRQVISLLAGYPEFHSSKVISRFLASARKTVNGLSVQDFDSEWKRVLSSLVDVWNIPIEKKIAISLRLASPFCQQPREGIRGSGGINILTQHIKLLAELLEVAPLLENVEFRFNQIAEAFQLILLGILDS